ncbi:MAG: hypothetical protein NC211_03495 [Alistipes senegalensis]|nr:hypothetical protein [Oxalobacter formigenes]MCM1280882.1 hypothetical protein [Alistipes senegalensis]
MADTDFSNAKLPVLLPLENSYAENEIESDLKKFFLDLFNEHLAVDTFDVNVLGAAHLGSFNLVRRSVNADGLVLLQGDREEAATRYLYRAWKSCNLQGRGLHFLRTYLQMLFPNQCKVQQLWHEKDKPYPTALRSSELELLWRLHYLSEPRLKLDGSWGVGTLAYIANADEDQVYPGIDTSKMWLTSRVELSLNWDINARSIASLMSIIRSVIPARLLPIFRLWMNLVLIIRLQVSMFILMQKKLRMFLWDILLVTEHEERRWNLGGDEDPSNAPRLNKRNIESFVCVESFSRIRIPVAASMEISVFKV